MSKRPLPSRRHKSCGEQQGLEPSIQASQAKSSFYRFRALSTAQMQPCNRANVQQMPTAVHSGLSVIIQAMIRLCVQANHAAATCAFVAARYRCWRGGAAVVSLSDVTAQPCASLRGSGWECRLCGRMSDVGSDVRIFCGVISDCTWKQMWIWG